MCQHRLLCARCQVYTAECDVGQDGLYKRLQPGAARSTIRRAFSQAGAQSCRACVHHQGNVALFVKYLEFVTIVADCLGEQHVVRRARMVPLTHLRQTLGDVV